MSSPGNISSVIPDESTSDNPSILEPSSHRRKRQRLSSPTYDEQIPLSQQEVAAFDTFEETLSQGSRKSSPFKASHSSSSLDRTRRDEIIASALGFKKLNTDEDMEDAFEGMQNESQALPV